MDLYCALFSAFWLAKQSQHFFSNWVSITLQFNILIYIYENSLPNLIKQIFGPKRQRKLLTIAEKAKLLDMLKEARSYAVVVRYYGIN